MTQLKVGLVCLSFIALRIALFRALKVWGPSGGPPTLPLCTVRNRDKNLVQSADHMLPKPTPISNFVSICWHSIAPLQRQRSQLSAFAPNLSKLLQVCLMQNTPTKHHEKYNLWNQINTAAKSLQKKYNCFSEFEKYSFQNPGNILSMAKWLQMKWVGGRHFQVLALSTFFNPFNPLCIQQTF